jgi:hypothetical protein
VKLFTAQRRRETTKLLQFLESMKVTSGYDRNTRQQSVSVRCHERNSLDPRKNYFLKLMIESPRFLFSRDTRLK